MGHKIFVSYKYGDYDVAPLYGYSNSGYTTPRQYVSYIDDVITRNYGHVFKGEDDNTDLRYLTEATIWSKLCDRIYDSSLTIILISPRMKDPYKVENAQWIPWEVSYSLRQTTRSDRTSRTNAMLAVVLPDSQCSYEYYFTTSAAGYSMQNTDILFSILKNNMFNERYPDRKIIGGSYIYYGDFSYISCVKWSDFISDMDRYINKAYEIQKRRENYIITTQVGV